MPRSTRRFRGQARGVRARGLHPPAGRRGGRPHAAHRLARRPFTCESGPVVRSAGPLSSFPERARRGADRRESRATVTGSRARTAARSTALSLERGAPVAGHRAGPMLVSDAASLSSLLVVSVATTVGEASGQSGRELVARLGCASCHGELAPAGTRAAPALALSAARTHPGSSRPSSPPAEDARGHAHARRARGSLERRTRGRRRVPRGVRPFPRARRRWLRRRQRLEARRAPLPSGRLRPPRPARGGRGDRSVGPMPAGGRALDHVAAKYTARGLAAFLHDPLAIGRQDPDATRMHLARRGRRHRRVSRAGRRGGGEALRPVRRASTPERVAAGRELYEELRCPSCHPVRLPGRRRRQRTSRSGRASTAARGTRRPLARRPTGARTRSAPRSARLSQRSTSRWRPRTRIEHTPWRPSAAPRATAWRRAPKGRADGARRVPGVRRARARRQRAPAAPPRRRRRETAADLARERPPRRRLGAALHAHADAGVQGENVAHLAALFEEVDATEEPLVFPKPSRETERESRDAARLLLGTTRLGCVSCHAFNAKRGPSFQGLD